VSLPLVLQHQRPALHVAEDGPAVLSGPTGPSEARGLLVIRQCVRRGLAGGVMAGADPGAEIDVLIGCFGADRAKWCPESSQSTFRRQSRHHYAIPAPESTFERGPLQHSSRVRVPSRPSRVRAPEARPDRRIRRQNRCLSFDVPSSGLGVVDRQPPWGPIGSRNRSTPPGCSTLGEAFYSPQTRHKKSTVKMGKEYLP
jgi:hypothetical protein